MRRLWPRKRVVDGNVRGQLAMTTMSTEQATIDYFQAKLLQAALECQQNFYEICSDWNLYEDNEHEFLKDFIGYALYGPPKYELSELELAKLRTSGSKFSHFVYDKDEKEAINVVYEQVIKYGTSDQSHGVILCGIIYNVIFNIDEAMKASTVRDAEKTASEHVEGTQNQTDDKKNDGSGQGHNGQVGKDEITEWTPPVYPVPVFKVRGYRSKEKNTKKCNGKAEPAENIERIYYIDTAGRVYTGFADYLENNTLPVCTMIVPKDGRYQADPAFSRDLSLASLDESAKEPIITKVWLEIQKSPAGNTAAKVLKGGDIASTVLTVAAMGVGIASLVTPIGPIVGLAGVASGGVGGLWSVGRCTQDLVDRGLHGESISVTDRRALGSWIGIAGGTMGVAATGGTALLARAVRTGTTVGRAAMIAHDAVLIGNLVVNGVGVGYKSYDIYAAYAEGGMSNISMKDAFFFTAHVFFFCNSVVNIRFAQNLVESTQGELLKDYESSLRSNRHRKEFQRLARNTRAAGTNDVSSNEEIIRAINKIDNKDDFFQAMVRNRKAFSAAGAKASFSSGKVTVNGLMTIDPIEFASLPKEIRIDIAKGVSSAPAAKPTSVPLVRNNVVPYKNFVTNNNNNSVLKEFCLKHSSAMMQSAPVVIGDFANVLAELRDVKNQSEIFLKLLQIAYRIQQALPRDEEITLGDTLAYIVQFLWDYVKSNLRRLRPDMIIEDPAMQALLNELMQILLCRVETKIEDWVRAFIRWLKKQFPQSINGPFLQHHHRLN